MKALLIALVLAAAPAPIFPGPKPPVLFQDVAGDSCRWAAFGNNYCQIEI